LPSVESPAMLARPLASRTYTYLAEFPLVLCRGGGLGQGSNVVVITTGTPPHPEPRFDRPNATSINPSVSRHLLTVGVSNSSVRRWAWASSYCSIDAMVELNPGRLQADKKWIQKLISTIQCRHGRSL